MITNEQIQQVFVPLFDAAFKYGGIQMDRVVQAAKAILAENLEKPLNEEEVKEDGGK